MTEILLKLSLVVNILVLIPVCLSLITGARWVETAYGPATPGRSIILSVYISILAVSLVLVPFTDAKLAAALLLVQVIYKLITPFATRSITNPVVVSNLLIAGLHVVTLVFVYRSL